MQRKEKIGLVLGPDVSLFVVALPEPSSMIDAARSVGAADFAPQVALGPFQVSLIA